MPYVTFGQSWGDVRINSKLKSHGSGRSSRPDDRTRITNGGALQSEHNAPSQVSPSNWHVTGPPGAGADSAERHEDTSKAITLLMPVGRPRIRSGACSGG
jgi:hypothetical protein